MIKIKDAITGELIAEVRDFPAVKKYFRLKGQNDTKSKFLNRPILSKRFNIKIIIEENNDIWLKNQTINFLKKIESKEL